jgi:cytochrome c-type protein NapB
MILRNKRMEKKMKITKLTLGLLTTAAFFIAGCTAMNQTMSEESIGLRNTDLYSETSETVGDKTQYIQKAPGQSELIRRAFENAPPMIPHDVEGMLPITINNNSCMGCHEPAVAKALNATPVPKSHLMDFRPQTGLNEAGRIVKEGRVVENTSDLKTVGKKLNQLSRARFNCSSCHAPQSMATNIPVTNEFQAQFRVKGAEKKSNLADNINEGVDTIK